MFWLTYEPYFAAAMSCFQQLESTWQFYQVRYVHQQPQQSLSLVHQKRLNRRSPYYDDHLALSSRELPLYAC